MDFSKEYSEEFDSLRKKHGRAIENILFDENGKERISLDRLKELIQADAEGLLHKFPCNIGDTVYEVQQIRKRIQPYTIIFIRISNHILFGWELKDGQGVYSNVEGFYNFEIGKTVFLTREEAEAALKKMGDWI